MTAQQQFETFLKKYDPAVAYEGKKCLAKLRKLVPGAIEMVYDNYNFLVVGSCPMDDSYVRTLIGHALKRAKVAFAPSPSNPALVADPATVVMIADARSILRIRWSISSSSSQQRPDRPTGTEVPV